MSEHANLRVDDADCHMLHSQVKKLLTSLLRSKSPQRHRLLQLLFRAGCTAMSRTLGTAPSQWVSQSNEGQHAMCDTMCILCILYT